MPSIKCSSINTFIYHNFISFSRLSSTAETLQNHQGHPPSALSFLIVKCWTSRPACWKTSQNASWMPKIPYPLSCHESSLVKECRKRCHPSSLKKISKAINQTIFWKGTFFSSLTCFCVLQQLPPIIHIMVHVFSQASPASLKKKQTI